VRPAAKTAGGTLAVPADAVQTVDGNPFVFVRLEEDLFELRRVTTGRRIRGAVTIQSGLHADDRVAMSQSFSLKSEVLRARLGASCADH
jgi:cobalt-zinc-cadmium efflux system membrane fusion protein